MRVIADPSLISFWEQHPESKHSLQAWRTLARDCSAANHSELKQTFNTVNYAYGKYTIFDVGGNKFRVITVIHYDRQKLFIRHVFKHTEYDDWNKGKRGN